MKDASLIRPLTPPSDALIRFQSHLLRALKAGWSADLPGAAVRSFFHFEGLRLIVRLVSSNGRGSRIRRQWSEHHDEFDFDIDHRRSLPRYEELRLSSRARIMAICADLLKPWPTSFVQTCQKLRISSSYINDYSSDLPNWLYQELKWALNDLDYAPCDEERRSVADYLTAQQLEVNPNSVAKLLGTKGRGRRWNRRGPKSKQV